MNGQLDQRNNSNEVSYGGHADAYFTGYASATAQNRHIDKNKSINIAHCKNDMCPLKEIIKK